MSKTFKEILKKYRPLILMVFFVAWCLLMPLWYQVQIQDLNETCAKCDCYGGIHAWEPNSTSSNSASVQGT